MPPTHRERVLAALHHEQTDRVPIDFGGLPTTGIHATAYARLLGLVGLELEANLASYREVLVPSERVLRLLDVDIRGAFLPEERRPEGVDAYRDEWGVLWVRADPASLFTTIQGPLQHLEEPEPSALEQISWPSSYAGPWLDDIQDRVEWIRQETDCAVVLNLSNSTFSVAQRVRGFAEFLEDLLLRRTFAEALLDRITDAVCSVATEALARVGDLIDCVSFMDDLGTQEATIISPELYRRAIKPYHARFIDTIRRRTMATIIMHSDGSIREILGDLIDCGVQVINPVQTSATGMDPESLKQAFGANLCFWGGVDIQHVLPHGSTDEVADEVRHLVSTLGRGGGYVLASGQNMLGEVPPENIAAMFNTARSIDA